MYGTLRIDTNFCLLQEPYNLVRIETIYKRRSESSQKEGSIGAWSTPRVVFLFSLDNSRNKEYSIAY